MEHSFGGFDSFDGFDGFWRLNLINFYSIITTIQFSVKKTTFYDKSSFLEIIGDAFRTEHACSLSSHFTYW